MVFILVKGIDKSYMENDILEFNGNKIVFRPISDEDKNMSNGMRDLSRTPLTDEEIEFVKSEIRRIGADESVFVFNDEKHIAHSTCYNSIRDIIYVTRNVFPDIEYASSHPRDTMSVGAVLAHEYYGHRVYREEYLKDLEREDNVNTTPYWQDEMRASLTAAEIAPGLTDLDRSKLVMDAIYRAEEQGIPVEMNDFMKEVLYGYTREERNIIGTCPRVNYIREQGVIRIE